MMLRPYLPIEPDESMMSWATRLAAVHARETLIPFLRDIGLHPIEMLKGSPLAVTRLTEVTGANPEDLLHQTIRVLEWRKHELRGERFEPEFLKGAFTSFCPTCLLEDDRAGKSRSFRRGRLMWKLRPVRTCALHGTLLVTRRHVEWSDRFDQMAVVVPESGRALSALTRDMERREVSPLQTYVVDRLEGVPGPAWLDGQTIEQAVRATEMLGTGLAFGRQPDLIGMSSSDWDRAGQVGFEFTKNGEEGVRAALGEMQHRAWFQEKLPVQSGPQLVLGPLYRWLRFSRSAKDSGPIRQVVRQHIIDTMAVAVGSKLLGKVVKKAKVHSVQSLSRQSGVHPKTLSNALIGAGLVSKGTKENKPHIFPALAGEKVVRQLREAIPQSQLRAYMNATRGQVVKLMRAGILTKMADGGWGMTRASVSKPAVDAFLAALARDAQDVSVLPAGVLPINKATMSARVTTEYIVNLLRTRRLKNVFRLAGTSGYLALHVDPEEIRRLFPADP